MFTWLLTHQQALLLRIPDKSKAHSELPASLEAKVPKAEFFLVVGSLRPLDRTLSQAYFPFQGCKTEHIDSILTEKTSSTSQKPVTIQEEFIQPITYGCSSECHSYTSLWNSQGCPHSCVCPCVRHCITWSSQLFLPLTSLPASDLRLL